MSANGDRRPAGAQIEIVSPTATESEAAAIAAALEQFLADSAPAPRPEGGRQSRWQRAALEEGIRARQIDARTWGSPASSW